MAPLRSWWARLAAEREPLSACGGGGLVVVLTGHAGEARQALRAVGLRLHVVASAQGAARARDVRARHNIEHERDACACVGRDRRRL